jgi:hypothetical protein
MKLTSRFLYVSACAVVAGALTVAISAQQPQPAAPAGRGQQQPPPPQERRPGHGNGQLIIWGDVALFEKFGTPDNCILQSRFRKGQRVGFRMTAIDGGTGETENTANMTIQLTHAGKTVDVPMRFRGAAGPTEVPRGYLAAPTMLWTGFWIVPADAPTGTVTYTVTATDAFGRKATFKPFPYETSQINIVP